MQTKTHSSHKVSTSIRPWWCTKAKTASRHE